jgi:lactoylglutathione lyase
MRIEHIAVWVRDLEVTKAFYEKYFGASAGALYENQGKQFSSYFLSFDDGCRLELMQMPGINEQYQAYQRQNLGLVHFAVSVGSKEKVDELTDRLRNDGFTIASEPRTTGDGYYESVVLDPEDNIVEITV